MGPQSQLHHWRKRAQSLDCFQPDRAEYKEQPVAQRRNTHTPPKKKKKQKTKPFYTSGNKILCGWERWRHCCFLTLESPCLWRKTEWENEATPTARLCFSKNSSMSVGSQGVHSSGFGALHCGILGRADSCVAPSACLAVWLGDSINMSSHKTLVRVSLNVCVRRMSVYVGRVTPCLRSRVQSISSLPFSPPYQTLNNSSHNTPYCIRTFPPLFFCRNFCTGIQHSTRSIYRVY